MPISDSYILQYLVQETSSARSGVVWSEFGGDTYRTELHGIQIQISQVFTRGGLRQFLTLSRGEARTVIAEPLNKGFLRAKYDSPEAESLAGLLQHLARCAAAQCKAREEEADSVSREGLRQTLFRHLLGY